MKKTLTIVSFQNPNNTYIKELISNLSEYYTVYWGNDFFWDKNFKTDHYIIHWPENIKVGQDRYSYSLSQLHERINLLKKHGSIVSAFFHDKTPHFSVNNFNTNLFKIVYTNVNKIFHLGKYSVDLIKEMFPESENIEHYIIKHALFESVPNTITTQEAKKYFNLDDKDFVITFVGNLRSQSEVMLLYKIFKKLKIKNKKLLIGGGELNDMRNFYTKQISRIKRYYYLGKNFKSSCGQFVEENQIQYYYKAADVTLVPRIQNLNSGIAIMSMTFGIPFVSPAVGNITELAEETGNYTFPLNDINKAVEIIENIANNKHTQLKITDDFLGKSVAKKIHEYLEKK